MPASANRTVTQKAITWARALTAKNAATAQMNGAIGSCT